MNGGEKKGGGDGGEQGKWLHLFTRENRQGGGDFVKGKANIYNREKGDQVVEEIGKGGSNGCIEESINEEEVLESSITVEENRTKKIQSKGARKKRARGKGMGVANQSECVQGKINKREEENRAEGLEKKRAKISMAEQVEEKVVEAGSRPTNLNEYIKLELLRVLELSDCSRPLLLSKEEETQYSLLNGD